jgi:plasmid stability protein
MTTKKIMLGVKVDPEFKDKVKATADAHGKDMSDYVREVLSAAMGSPVHDPIKAALAEAMVVLLASSGRPISTEQAIKLVKDLFLTGAFKEEVRHVAG